VPTKTVKNKKKMHNIDSKFKKARVEKLVNKISHIHLFKNASYKKMLIIQRYVINLIK
jgi:hypothetical protein